MTFLLPSGIKGLRLDVSYENKNYKLTLSLLEISASETKYLQKLDPRCIKVIQV